MGGAGASPTCRSSSAGRTVALVLDIACRSLDAGGASSAAHLRSGIVQIDSGGERLVQLIGDASRTDPLTGLLSRRAWEEALQQGQERAERTGSPYSLVLADVDYFKAFNDSAGHPAGDDCLRRLAHAIASVCRSIDFVGRYGGEEFIALAADTDEEGAWRLAERIRQVV